MKLSKAVFPVAGMGTRFLPATKTIPKEMLPVVDKPIIQYAVNEAIEAGCDTLIFVTGRSKRALEDYFDRSPELEAELEAKGKIEILDTLKRQLPSHVKVVFVRQPQALGLGHAVLCAAPLIQPDELFAVLLPDDLIEGFPTGSLSQMLPEALSRQSSVIAVEEVPGADVEKYGVVDISKTTGRSSLLKGIVEKPPRGQAPSNDAVVGRYILHPGIMAHLRNQAPGRGGEIQLTDAIATEMKVRDVFAYKFLGRRFDCGSPLGFLEANHYFGEKLYGSMSKSIAVRQQVTGASVMSFMSEAHANQHELDLTRTAVLEPSL
jgi:UTP--glucose-1-phosphate uridylyltransferase